MRTCPRHRHAYTWSARMSRRPGWRTEMGRVNHVRSDKDGTRRGPGQCAVGNNAGRYACGQRGSGKHATPAAASPADTTGTTLKAGQDRVVQELDTVARDRLPSTGPDTLAPVESINIHFLVGAKVGTTTSGLTAVHNVAKDADGAIRKIINGTQILVILRGRDAPTNISYVVSGPNIHLSPDALGGIVVSKADGKRVGYINAPWAAGRARQVAPNVIQSQRECGHAVRQHSRSGLPSHRRSPLHMGLGQRNRILQPAGDTRPRLWSWWSRCSRGSLAPPFDGVVSGLSGILAAEVAIAENHGWCVKVNTKSQIGFYSGTQGDGYCR